MGRKSRTNRSKNRVVQQGPSRALLKVETIIERKTQAQIYEDLIRKHRGDVPARECWNHLADRREAAITTTHGAELAARG